MRKFYYFISAAIIALGLASCNKEDVVSSDPAQTNRQITIIANTEGSVDTKTSLSGDDATGYEVLWSEGDRIILNDGNYSGLTLTEGAGTTRGTFVAEGNIEDGTYDVFYATNGKNLTNGSKHKSWAAITSVPMKASVTIENGVVASATEFKSMCGLLRLTLKGSGTVKEVKISEVENTEPLYGPISGYKEDGCSVVVDYSTFVNPLKQDCGEGVELSSDKGTDFYFPLPPNDYHGIKIEVTDFSGNTVTKTMKSDKTLNIARAMITPVSLTISGLETTPLSSGELTGDFTVNASGKKVHFSRGNLYWDGDSFEFEEQQNDYPNTRNDNHIGHLCWGNEDWSLLSGGTWGDSHIIFTNDPNDAEKANAEFTVNGVQGEYRTLSRDEWVYLLSNHKYTFANVEGVNGVVIAPDGVTLTANKTSYSNAELKNGNLVCLPITGYFDHTRYGGLIDCGGQAYYRASTTHSQYTSDAVYLSNYRKSISIYSNLHVSNGCAIRLVKDVN